MGIDQLAHLLVISLQNLNCFFRLGGFAEGGEAADVAEQHAQKRPVARQHLFRAGGHHRIGHGCRHEAFQTAHPFDFPYLFLDARFQFAVQSFQRLELPHVLNGNGGLRGKGLHKGDVIRIKGCDLEFRQTESANDVSVLKHRNGQKRPDTVLLCMRHPLRITGAIEFRVPRVVDLNRNSPLHSLRKARCAVQCPCHVAILRMRESRTMQRGIDEVRAVLVHDGQTRVVRLAKHGHPLQNRLKHRGFIVPVRGNCQQHLCRGFFSRQSILHLAELTHILDGDDSLRSEGFDKR